MLIFIDKLRIFFIQSMKKNGESATNFDWCLVQSWSPSPALARTLIQWRAGVGDKLLLFFCRRLRVSKSGLESATNFYFFLVADSAYTLEDTLSAYQNTTLVLVPELYEYHLTQTQQAIMYRYIPVPLTKNSRLVLYEYHLTEQTDTASN